METALSCCNNADTNAPQSLREIVQTLEKQGMCDLAEVVLKKRFLRMLMGKDRQSDAGDIVKGTF